MFLGLLCPKLCLKITRPCSLNKPARLKMRAQEGECSCKMLHNLGLPAHPLKGGPEWSGIFIISFYTSRERRGRSSYIIFRQTPVKSLQDVVGRAGFLRGLQWPLGLLGRRKPGAQTAARWVWMQKMVG